MCPDFPPSGTANLDVPLSSRAAKDQLPAALSSEGNLRVSLESLDLLLRSLLNTPLARAAIDSSGRLRIIIDAAGTATPVSGTVAATQSGTWNLGNLPVDQRWELMQRANIEYQEVQRSKMTIT